MVVIKIFDSKGVKIVENIGDVVNDVPYEVVEEESLCEPTSEPEEES